jgi:hypothetical protein
LAWKNLRGSKLQNGIEHGYRSGLENLNARFLTEQGVDFKYETIKIPFVEPSKKRTYTPDFLLPNGIFIETKGRFTTADRQKHLLIKEQYGDKYDIRFVFSSSSAPIYKGANTTCAMWAEKHGFKWASRSIPREWIKEKGKVNT